MSQIQITQMHAAGLINARTSHDPKAARKSMWARIREDLSLPSDVRLKVEVNDTYSVDYLKLKDANSGAYLWRVGDEVVVSNTQPVTVDASQLVGATVQATLTPAAASRFATTAKAPDTTYAITVDALLAILRGDTDDVEDYTYVADRLPSGFPGVRGDGVVLDTTDRVLYFAG